jgi:hypothetical protein
MPKIFHLVIKFISFRTFHINTLLYRAYVVDADPEIDFSEISVDFRLHVIIIII